MYIISKCLLGENCKYNGGNNRSEDVVNSHMNILISACVRNVPGGFPLRGFRRKSWNRTENAEW